MSANLLLWFLYSNNTQFLYNSIDKIYQIQIRTSITNLWWWLLLNKKSVYNTKVLVRDAGGIITKTNKINLYYTIINLIDNYNFKINLNLNNLTSLTYSNIFLGCSWLERELSEFIGIKFSKLRDTRRLLLDYSVKKGLNIKNYNKIIYYSQTKKNIL